MKNVLNKSIAATDNKTGRTAPGKDTMNKEFQKVIAAAHSISSLNSNVPQLREKYTKEIEDAQAAQRAAKEAKNEALSGVDFDNACDRERNAREKEVFFKRKLEELDFTPRMDEREYEAHVKAVQTVVEQSAADYREKAVSLMSELAAIHRNYMKLAADADQTLETLDQAANVLQSKHRYKVTAWKNHAVRYGYDGAHGMVAHDDNPYINSAWLAASSIVGEQDHIITIGSMRFNV